MMKKRRVFIGFVLAWLIWFLNSAITGRTGAIIDIYERGTLAWQSTIELVQAVGKCLYFWVNFTAPFIIDVGNLVSRLNATLTWRMRIMMTAFLSIVIGLYLIARQVVLHQEGVKRVAFQSSILIVAPSLWMGLAIIPNAELWLPTTLMLATSVYPCIQSARSFWTRDVEACGRWLRYWVVFPIVDACREALQEYQTGLFQQQQQQHAYDGGDGDVSDSAPPSDGTAIRDAQRILLIFTLWLQVWDGSLSFHRICTHVGSWLWRSLPVRIVPRSFTTKWHKIRHINVLKRVMMLVTDNLLASSMLLAVLGVFVVFFFKLLSRVVPLMIMWGASVNAAEVVLRNIHQLYEQNLAFWILMQGSSLTVLKVPVLGTLMSWFRIPMLVCFYMFGQQLLNVLGDAIGVCANSPSIRGTGGGVAGPSSPGGSSSSSSSSSAFTGGGGSGASHNMGSSSSSDSSRSIVINTSSSGTAASGASAAVAAGGGSGGGSASLEGGGGGGGGGGGNPPASPSFSPATTKSAASPLSSSSSSSSSSSFLSFFGSLPSAATSSALLLFSSSVSSRRKKKQLQQQQHNRNNHHNTSPSAPSSSVVMHVKDRSPSVIRERVTPSSSSSSSHQATTDGMGVGLSIVFGEGDKEA